MTVFFRENDRVFPDGKMEGKGKNTEFFPGKEKVPP